MSFKNKLIKALIWAFAPKASRSYTPSSGSKFLIVSTTGLGDTLWGTPAIRALRRSFPDGMISVLTSSVGFQVLQHNKNIDELFVINSSTILSLLQYLNTLKKRNFDAVLIFHTSQRFVLPFCALLEAPIIIGTKGINKGLDFLLTKPLPKKYQHEIERRLDIAKAAGAFVNDFYLEMPISREDELNAKRLLERHNIPEHIPIIGLHPGAKNTFKQWPTEHFIEVGKNLIQHLGCQIIVSGDKSEAPLVFEIASKIPGAIPIAGELDIPSFTALLKKMALFITNDTGPMHLSFAAQTPTVALFGPTDPHLCGPFHFKNGHVLSRSKTCTPCLKKKCADPFCMRQIGPDEVVEAALATFYEGSLIPF